MPYAQWHFPFENKEVFAQNYPADFIAEGVDQTRGWFYTLHAIAALVKESVQEELRGMDRSVVEKGEGAREARNTGAGKEMERAGGGAR